MLEFDSDATDRVLRLFYQSGVGIFPSGIAVNLDDGMVDPPSRTAGLDPVRELNEANYISHLNEVESCYLTSEDGKDYAEAALDDEAMSFH